jgi:streptogramin lyase
VWFNEVLGGNIGRITPAGVITEFPATTPLTPFTGWIVAGPTNLWFVRRDSLNSPPANPQLAEMTTSGVVTQTFPLPPGTNASLTLGPDGNIWFTEYNNSEIGHTNPDGTFTLFSAYDAADIIKAPDGNLWFDAATSTPPNSLGRITPAGAPMLFTYPDVGGPLRGLTVGPDGNLWAADASTSQIDRFNTAGQLTGQWSPPTPNSGPYYMVAGLDGALWFTERAANQIGRITVDGAITEYPTPTPNSDPEVITKGPDGNLWFTEHAANQIGEVVVNVAPTVGAITAPQAPVPINTSISVSASFTDPNVLDTHTAVWNWGDGQTAAGTVTESNGSGTVSGSHTYTADGVYTVTLTVTDQYGASSASSFSYVVVYNASAGFVTGSGRITSPAGAYTANPALTGKASFGFNAKYQSGSTAPAGSAQFQFPAANLSFQSTGYDWLIISGSQAQFQGSGTINGAGNYGFLIAGLDNGGGHTPDAFRIKIWDKNNNNAVIYDTQPGAPITATPTTLLDNGRIQVHSNGPSIRSGGTGGSQAPPAAGGGAGTTSGQTLVSLLTPGGAAAPLVTEGGSHRQAASLPVGRDVVAPSQVDVNSVDFSQPVLPRSPSTLTLDGFFADLLTSGLTDALVADTLLTPRK